MKRDNLNPDNFHYTKLYSFRSENKETLQDHQIHHIIIQVCLILCIIGYFWLFVRLQKTQHFKITSKSLFIAYLFDIRQFCRRGKKTFVGRIIANHSGEWSHRAGSNGLSQCKQGRGIKMAIDLIRFNVTGMSLFL